jgi:hypothetical protein
MCLNRAYHNLCWPSRTSFQISTCKEDKFFPQSVELLLGSARLQNSPADPNHRTLKHGGYKLRVFRQWLAGGRQHCHNRFAKPHPHLLRDLRSVYIGAYGVESGTRLRIRHLGFKKRRNESRRHVLKSVSLLLPAGSFHRLCNLIEMTSQHSLQQRALVRKVLIQGSDRHAGSRCDSCRGQPLLSNTEQNLNGCFENGVHACGRTRLNRRFTGLQDYLGTLRQMRTPD